MRKLRASERQIVYIDETWIDSNLTFKKCWQHDTVLGAQINVSSKNRLIVVHAGSYAGFVPGAQLVYNASVEKLLPNLRRQSVVCMDNAPYHTKTEDPTPTKYATKQTLVNWLMKKTICCDPKMRKAELFNVIECNRPKKVIYKIDNIIKENGHHVVRLPPYHCDLNKIEYVWSSVKRLNRERNVTGDLSLKILKNLT
ncbi:uncharacterized protein LOC118189628 [Stegodyphus dumicola]|uniref:uncharacterized protein LOC118189628 n=1 Tax=Stegodyphus dumicola TaxID=202533 RepID=UPI0015B27EE0|nr:uncharacterized protein LOC118189628 [Stegodyphus dumicola]